MMLALGQERVSELDSGMKEYRRLDPTKYFITAYWDKYRETHTATVWANTDNGPLALAKLKQPQASEFDAIAFASHEFPVIAVITKDEAGRDVFAWPFYDERKGRFLAEARERRDRRMQKAVDRVNLMVGVASALDPSIPV